MADDAGACIEHPTGVQVLTEEEFFEEGRRVGAAPPRPEARQFATAVTALLATNEVARYARMRHDFQVLEVGALMAFASVPTTRLGLLLDDYPLSDVDIPAYVGGVRRGERGEAVCESVVSETVGPRQRRLSITEHVNRYDLEYRGGVDAGVKLEPDKVARDRDGQLTEWRRLVRSTRPSADSWRWTLPPLSPSAG